MITITLSPVKYETLILLLNAYKKESKEFKAIQNACDEVLKDLGVNEVPSQGMLDKSNENKLS